MDRSCPLTIARILRAGLAGLAALAATLACTKPPALPAPRDAGLPSAGTYLLTLDERAGAEPRSARVYVPQHDEASGDPLPLVVALHGGMSGAKTLQGRAGFDALADELGFLVAYPNGEGAEGLFRHWNAGHCCGHAKSAGRDDVGFVLRVVDAIGEALPLDGDRVYVTGFSNGGMLAYRVGAAHAERIAGVGAVAASIAGAVRSDDPEERMPEPGRPLPVIVFQGREDPRVPEDHVEVSLAWWAERNGCSDLPRERALREGRIRVRTWDGCAAGGALEAWTLEDWGHRWPGPAFSNRRDENDPLHGFDGGRMMWEFFERHPRSGRRISP